jgi:hypothetical protein
MWDGIVIIALVERSGRYTQNVIAVNTPDANIICMPAIGVHATGEISISGYIVPDGSSSLTPWWFVLKQ